MNHKLYLVFLIWFTSFSLCFGLTPAERKIVLHAKSQLEMAVQEQKHSKDLADWAVQSNQEAWGYAAETGAAAQTAKDEAQRQANEVAKMKPVYDACTRWFGIGAIVYGVQQLLKNLLILALVGTVLMGAIYALSFAFPFFGIAFNFVWGFLKKFFKIILDRFTKK